MMKALRNRHITMPSAAWIPLRSIHAAEFVGMQQIPDRGSDKISPLVQRQISKLGRGRMKTDKDKKIQKSGKKETSIVRSSAAEYLTFVAATGQGGVEAVYADENIWLTQKMMGVLYDVETHTINYHLKKVFADSELEENSVTRNFRITAADGKNYNTRHYNLSAIIAVGYKEREGIL
jgi:hypothetical protein